MGASIRRVGFVLSVCAALAVVAIAWANRGGEANAATRLTRDGEAIADVRLTTGGTVAPEVRTVAPTPDNEEFVGPVNPYSYTYPADFVGPVMPNPDADAFESNFAPAPLADGC